MYNEFYGFSETPFETIPDPKFIYLVPGHQEILDAMMRQLKERKEFIAIIGTTGTGKTALLYYLATLLEKKTKGVIIPNPFATIRELIRGILLELNPEATEGDQVNHVDQLVHSINLMNDRGERLVLMIDEAQSLSMEAMEELRVFLNRMPKIIQVIFAGRPEFKDKIHAPGLRWLKEKIKDFHQIKPFTEKESLGYMNHRLRLVGGNSFKLLTAQALAMICTHAQGTPLSLNILCDNALRVGQTLSRKQIDTDIIQKVIRELDGPGPSKVSFPSIRQTKKRWPSSLRLNLSLKHVILSALFLFCLGALILLIRGTFQQTYVQWGKLDTIKSPTADRRPIEPKPASPASPQSLLPLRSSLVSDRTEHPLIEKVTVTSGQTISSLSQQYYRMTHETLLDIIWDFNPEIDNPHLIFVNQEIKIPRITEELFIIRSSEGAYKIYAGTFTSPDILKTYRVEPLLAEKDIEIIPRRLSVQETWYRMMIGNFENEGEALKVIHLLKEKGLLPSFKKTK